MLICEWHIDIPFGRQAEALEIIKAWNRAKRQFTEFRRSSFQRLVVGHIGVSPSHIVDAYDFDSLEDYEAAISGLSHPSLRQYSEAIAPLIVPGSQHWRVFRVIEELGDDAARDSSLQDAH